MNLSKYSLPPLFSKPEEIYLPLPKFTADAAGAKLEIQNTIATLNAAAGEFSSSKSFTKDYLDLIARGEEQAAAQRWAAAHRTLWDAAFLINRGRESQAAGKFRRWIGCYLALWLVFLAYGGWWWKNCQHLSAPELFLGFSYWRYVMMGALGGITIAVWGLMLHTANLDFDRHFAVWYWFKPVLGAVTGLIVVLTVLAGLFAVEGTHDIKSEKALYVLAFLAGFSERFFLRIIEKLMTTLFGGESSSTPSKPATTKAAAAEPLI